MRTAKSSITRLKTSMNETLPNGSDIFGFPGVTKEILLEGMEETYGLLDGFAEDKDSFDVIFMKRILAERTKSANEYLKDGIKKMFDQEKRFNSFLNDIFVIRKVVKETYLLVVKNGLRSEAELQQTYSALEDYKVELNDYIKLHEEVEAANKEIFRVKKELEDFRSSYQESDTHVREVVGSVDTFAVSIEDSKEKAIEAKEDIVLTRSQILRNKASLKRSIERYEELVNNLQEQEARIQVQFEQIESIDKQQREQQENIQNIIDDANRASMAGSFLKRKEELKEPIKWSGRIMNLALIATAGVSAYLLITTGILDNSFDYISFLTKLPILAPFIWIAWSNSQRNNYLVRIQEDYAFKYASAMAFEGYRKQVQEVDEDLEKRLLELAVENMGANPIRLFDKPIKASPASEVLNSAKEVLTEAKSSQN
ncbi:hypothetical protein L1D34_07240 [Vibrio mediterranei]|uniref:hypothetical protein n=1 Tax=Vibrio mediterranei TaxID=689 RepID=UPI001EFE3B4C|nr:hypothetical protein [Vibrio mediterranei]MCG9624633.1 hypothetical protein [Vibrio mediterranei]